MQTCLFPTGEPGIDPAFRGARRLELGEGAWCEHVSSWMSGHDVLFDFLRREVTWRAERRWMYEREVAVPRLVGRAELAIHPALGQASTALSARYGWTLDRLGMCLYRDGADSVAEHGDRMGPLRANCVVAIVSLGAPRLFTLRPASGGRAKRFYFGWGDLFVMGGTCQETWLHGVPKVPSADPRISVQFRPEGPPDMGRR
jgi:alkylated DNA repair dioxygenase AlkB